MTAVGVALGYTGALNCAMLFGARLAVRQHDKALRDLFK